MRYDPHDDPYDPDDDVAAAEDPFCDGGCGRDLDEVDGNTFELESGVILSLCGDCEIAMRIEVGQ